MKIFFVILIISSSLSKTNAQIKGVKYGAQVWMVANLDVNTFRNGDPIPEARADTEWVQAALLRKPAWCYYDNDPVNGRIYGKLYNWYAVIDPRGLAPQGWHIPGTLEWLDLYTLLGGGENAAYEIRAKTGWYDEEYVPDSTKGFKALPGGARVFKFQKIGEYGYWWTKTDEGLNTAWSWTLGPFGAPGRYKGFKVSGMSVRCVKD